jgi:hypothetical protein
MYRIQEVYTTISVKPVLLSLFIVKTVNFPAAKMETVAGSRGRLFGLRLDGPEFGSRCGKEILVFSKMSRRALGSTERLFEWAPAVLSAWSKEAWNFTTQLNLVPRLRMCGDVPLLPLYVFMMWTGRNLPLLALIYETPPILYIYQLSAYFTSWNGKS